MPLAPCSISLTHSTHGTILRHAPCPMQRSVIPFSSHFIFLMHSTHGTILRHAPCPMPHAPCPMQRSEASVEFSNVKRRTQQVFEKRGGLCLPAANRTRMTQIFTDFLIYFVRCYQRFTRKIVKRMQRLRNLPLSLLSILICNQRKSASSASSASSAFY